MSSNNHALIRYRTIDRCLKSKSKKNYFLKDLIKACSDAVHEYEESRTKKKKPYKEISRRSLMYDLKFMKDDVYGFSAPIDHDREEGYYYTDPSFEAFRAKISMTDRQRLDEALNILKQLAGQNQFADLDETILRLEDTYQIKRKKKNPDITVQFEHSTNAEGIKWLSKIKDFIRDKQVVRIKYQPFEANPFARAISPYILKEYNNRWYVVGYDHEKEEIRHYGLDRIKKVDISILDYHSDETFDASTYLQDIVGITRTVDGEVENIRIKVFGKQRYYVDTKPFHHTQRIIKETKDYSIFELDLIINYEITTKLFAMADSLYVMKPASLRRQVEERIHNANTLYKLT